MDGVKSKRARRPEAMAASERQATAGSMWAWLGRLCGWCGRLWPRGWGAVIRLARPSALRQGLRWLRRMAWPPLDERHRPRKLHLAAVAIVIISVVANVLLLKPTITHATTRGDGVLFYGLTGNTTPQYRTHSGASNNFSAAAGTVAGAVPAAAIIRTSPLKVEAIAGYVSAGTLQVMCYNGTTWSNEWTATVTNVASRRPFDIAYESVSGKAVVTYATGTNSGVGFRTKANSAACGSANWSSATTFATNGNIAAINWMTITADPGSNTLAALFEDNSRVLTSMVWSTSTWTNEVTISTQTDWTAATTDVEAFGLAYESLTGNLMIAWGENAAGQHIFYRQCTGGGSGCTWGSKTNMPTLTGLGTVISMSANPASNQIVFASIDDTGGSLSVGYWSGTTWTNTLNLDASTEVPVSGSLQVATSWLTFSTTTRSLVVYADLNSQHVDYYTGNGGTFTVQTDFTPSPLPTTDTRYYRLAMDPFNAQYSMLTFTDSNSNLYAKRAAIDISANVTWTNTDGSATLASTLSTPVAGPASFAYWNSPVTLDQTIYRWYGNVDAVQPTTALAAENTGISLTDRTTILRLRMGLTNKGTDMSASSQAFKLQYATDQNNGPWTDVASASADPWCNATASPFCDTSWSYRRKITFSNGTASGSISNFPILVRLSSTNFDYSKAQSAGQDLRFVDAGSPDTLLSYEIETWNTSGESIVWVKKPALAATNSDYIFMYYGNGTAATGANGTAVWTNGYLSVFHLKEDPTGTAPQFLDSTGNAASETNHNMVAGDQTAGQVDGSISLNGTTKYATGVATGPGSVKGLGAYTISAWTFSNSLGTRRDVYEETITGDQTKSRLKFDMEATNQFALLGRAKDTDAAIVTWVTSSLTISSGTWYYVTGVWQGSGAQSITVNGTKTTATTAPSQTTIANTNPASEAIGIHTPSAPAEFWNGQIDELRISNVARSDDWINADYRVQSDPTFTTYNGEESQGGGVWRYYNNPTPADGATITANLLTGAAAKESYTESKPTASNPNAIGTNAIGEWDFSLDPASACTGTYYFRMVKADGTVITSYTQYPSVTLTVGAPVDVVMRHGGWWNSNTKQPYSCDWVPG